MADTRTPEQRSRIMKAVGTKDTGPELVVRKLLFAQGLRYRLHRRDLPGRPDIVFPSRRKAIFVHGCFWHGHGCSKGRAAKSRTEYWGPKLQANRARDAKNIDKLQAQGWKTLIVWQCELADTRRLLPHLMRFVEGGTNSIDKTRTKR